MEKQSAIPFDEIFSTKMAKILSLMGFRIGISKLILTTEKNCTETTIEKTNDGTFRITIPENHEKRDNGMEEITKSFSRLNISLDEIFLPEFLKNLEGFNSIIISSSKWL